LPRAKKILPLRRTTWLVLKKGDELLLERRPSPGIWGGLWCFPERDGEGRRLDVIEHGFTHFRLRIQPVIREVRKKSPEGAALRWMRIRDVASAAVPTPVRRLVSRLR
jgi:A/G-specific adenine glycosylase